MALLGLMWLTLVLAVAPWGDFPLNDDFVYAETVRRWLADGRLTLSQWAVAPSLAPIGLAALAGRLIPPTNENLRLLNLALGGAGAAVFYAVLRLLDLPRERAVLGSALLAANPVYLAMSASFHSDVTALLLQSAAFMVLLRRGGEGPAGLAAASVLLCGAALSRPTAALSAAGVLLWKLRRGRLTPVEAAALLGPLSIAGGAFIAWFLYVHGPTWAWRAGHQSSAFSWASLDGLRVNACLQMTAFFLAPLGLACLGARDLRVLPSVRLALLLAAVAALGLAGLRSSGGLPILENTLHHLGLGVLTLNDPSAKAAGLWGRPGAWLLAGLIALVSSLALGRLAFRPCRRRPGLGAALWFFLPPYLALFLLPKHYDRYLLSLLPAAIAAVLLTVEEGELNLPAAWTASLLLALLSVAGLRDYFSWNRARWEAGRYAVGLGLAPSQVENGFDWDGQFTLEANLRRLLAERPADRIGPWDWMALNRVAAATSFSRRPPAPGFRLIRSFPYRTPLTRGEPAVFLHGLPPPSPGGIGRSTGPDGSASRSVRLRADGPGRRP